jgi:TM2 domain-containing membrane protein YozV
MTSVGDWYYIGHYGQLGPLTRDQIDELIEGDVIAQDTYVWRVGMTEWIAAGRVTELSGVFRTRVGSFIPPPPPAGPIIPPPEPPSLVYAETDVSYAPVYANYQPVLVTLKSDKSRALAGLLQLFLPGIGRIYLGYSAYGVLQLFFTLCGVGWVWSFIDGIIILAGGVKYDGYGRKLGQ